MNLIAVTSPATDAGKTFIAASIAEASTNRKLKTLFIDFDNPVGDSLRVFGISPRANYPTIGSWKNHNNLWEDCLKSHAGTFLLPKPEILHEQIDAPGLLEVVSGFDLVVADLGTDFRQDHWEYIIDQATLALLVSDCDEKAFVRIQSFLNTVVVKKEWHLIVNSREKDNYYSEDQIVREFTGRVQNIITLPYFSDAEKKSPKTFPPDNPFILEILSIVFEDIVVPEKVFPVKLPKIPQIKLPQRKPKPARSKPSIDKEQVKEPVRPQTPVIESMTPVIEPEDKELFLISKGEVSYAKSGQIRNGQLIELSQAEISENIEESDGVIIPASWGIDFVKKFRRKYTLTPIVVVGGKKEHLAAGADRCVKKLSPQVIAETISMSERIKALWAKVEIEPLTGLYSRNFLLAWIRDREQNKKPFSAVMLDIDKFKHINDTYGHQAGDLVLSTLGDFLKTNSRIGDIAARYGGEEFAICLPDTSLEEGYKLIDRLRSKWANRRITLDDGRTVMCTFSAGIAEWAPGIDVLVEADKRLYAAKERGRNRVVCDTTPAVLMLGQYSLFNDSRIRNTDDPSQAIAVISDPTSIRQAPPNLPLYIVLSGTVGAWTAKKNRTDAVFCSSISEAIDLILKPKLTVLPGVRAGEKGLTIPYNGALYIVSPSRPALAGEVAAVLCKEITKCALVCATPESMGAVSLGLSPEQLAISDWRFPGGEAPVDWYGTMVWPVDPYKYISTNLSAQNIVDQIKSHFTLVIIDCAASLDICARVARNEGILVLAREGDASDQTTQYWLRTYGGPNVTVINPTETPALQQAENGFVLSRNLAVQNY